MAIPTITDLLNRAADIYDTTAAILTPDAVRYLVERVGLPESYQTQSLTNVIAAAAAKYNTTVTDITDYCRDIIADRYGVTYSADPTALTGEIYTDWLGKGPVVGTAKQPVNLGTGSTLPVISALTAPEIGDYYNLQVTVTDPVTSTSTMYTRRYVIGGFILGPLGDPTDPTDYIINWVEGEMV